MQSDKLAVIYTISSKSNISKNIRSPEITKELRWILQELGVVGCVWLSDKKKISWKKFFYQRGWRQKICSRRYLTFLYKNDFILWDAQLWKILKKINTKIALGKTVLGNNIQDSAGGLEFGSPLRKRSNCLRKYEWRFGE